MWASVEALADDVYSGEHLPVMRRRREWFAAAGEATTALWWIPAGHRPSTAEAEERIRHLRVHGPTSHAFTFRHPFPAPDGTGATAGNREDWLCPA